MALSDIIIILILATLPAYIFSWKLKVERQGPLILWRTKKGLKLLDRLARYKKFLKYFSEAGFVFAFGVFGAGYIFLNSKRDTKALLKTIITYLVFIVGASIVAVPVVFTNNAVPLEFLASLYIGGTGAFVLYGLMANTLTIIQSYMAGFTPMPGIAPIIPGVEIQGSPLFVPIHALFGLIILVVVHEFSHGIVARAEKIKVKSLGVLTAGIFPIGAFTEPDEKQLKKVATRKRMRVFSSGSMANFLCGIIFLALFMSSLAVMQPKFVQDPTSVTPSYIPWSKDYINYLQIADVENGSIAQSAGFMQGMKIYNIDVAFSSKEPFAVETFVTDNGTITMQRNSSGYFGFSYYANKNSNYPPGILLEKYYIESLFWIFVLNFLVGVINFLPFAIFDGARIFEDLFNFYMIKLGIRKRIGEKAIRAMTVFILVLFLINALPYFIARF